MNEPVGDPFGEGYEDPELEFEESEQEQGEDEAWTALAEAVSQGASELQDLASARLSAALVSRVSDAATTPAANPLEVIRNPVEPGCRLDVLQNHLDTALSTLKPADVSEASIDFLDSVFGLDLSNVDFARRAGTAQTLLTHIVYSATGHPLLSTTSSDAAQTVADVTAKFNALTDAGYWGVLADAYDGETPATDELREHLVFMGLTAELKPMTTSFTWPTADAAAFQVDQLISAASRGEGLPVDMAAMYRRASELTMNGKSIPRAVTAELVRMALAELSAGVHPSVGAFETPSPSDIRRGLVLEPTMSDPTESQAADQRNQVRQSAEQVLTSVRFDAPRLGASAGKAALRLITRAGRGYLGETMTYQATRIVHAGERIEGGGEAASDLRRLLTSSHITDALDAWSKAYRSGTTDPATLRPLLDDVASKARFLDTAIKNAFPSVSPGQSMVSTLKGALLANVEEVAYEATELLKQGAKTMCSQVGAVATLVETYTIQTRNRSAAEMARDSKLGLADYVTKTARGFEKTAWFADLKAAASAWSVADSRDLASLSNATAAFSTTLARVSTQVKSMPTGRAAEAATAQNMIDGLATAVIDRIERFQAADPQGTAKDLPSSLTLGLQACQITLNPPAADLAAYWRQGKQTITGTLLAGMDAGLADKLAAWQKAAAGTPDPTTLAQTTYTAVDAIIDYRQQVEKSDLTNDDKAILLGLLDNLLAAMSARLSAIRGL